MTTYASPNKDMKASGANRFARTDNFLETPTKTGKPICFNEFSDKLNMS
jgi:hypothetical protein